MRIETVINDPNDLGVLRRIVHLDELVGKARAVNRRLLDAERVGQGCVLASPAFERIARPSLVDGRRAPALRFGDPRVMALAGALAVSSNLIGGFSNKTIRPADRRAARRTVQPGQVLLRPAPVETQRPHPKGRAHQHLRPHRRTGNASRSSTPRSGTGSYDHCWPPIRSPHHSPSDKASEPSTGPSPTTSPTPTGPPENSAQLSNH